VIVGHPGLELTRGERAAGGHLGQDRCHDVRVLSGHTLHPAPGILLGAVHPEAEVPPDRPRHEAGFVSPVLADVARGAIPQRIEQTGVVGTQSGEEGEVLTAGEHIDTVDLDDADGVDHPLEVPDRGGTARPWPRESLCGQGNPPRTVAADHLG